MNPSADNTANRTTAAAFQLADLQVDPNAGEIQGPAGREKLDPKVMDVLVELARNAGQVVLREDLLTRLWPGVVVTDEVLSRCIYELRRHLARASGDDSYREKIETIPKRGYRLNADVMSTRREPPTVPRRRRPYLAIGVAAAFVIVTLAAYWLIHDRVAQVPPMPSASSIAVLPFIDMSPGKDQAYLADGFAEEILNRLAQAENLRVIARTSSFSFRDRPLEIAEIAKQLNVSHVLEGSVRKSGDQLRITAQLIAASNSSHIWSHTYDRSLGDLFAIQDEIATSVTDALAVTLSQGRRAAPQPSNVGAHEQFLQAEFFYNRRAPGDMERSIKSYESAITLDPMYANAWASLALAYSMQARETDPPSASLQDKQGNAARRAVEVGPNLAAAHLSLYQYYLETGNESRAAEHLDRAKQLDPEDIFFEERRIEEAIDKGDIAAAIAMQSGMVARDPLAASLRNNLGVYLLAAGRYDEALTEFRSVQAIHPETDPNVSIDIVHVLLLKGLVDDASREVVRVPEGNQRDQAMALIHAAAGRAAESDEAVQRMRTGSNGFMETVRLAEVYAFRHMNDQAFEVLNGRKQALLRDHGADSAPYIWYLQHESKLSPFLKVLHKDSRWSEFDASVDHPQRD